MWLTCALARHQLGCCTLCSFTIATLYFDFCERIFNFPSCVKLSALALHFAFFWSAICSLINHWQSNHLFGSTQNDGSKIIVYLLVPFMTQQLTEKLRNNLEEKKRNSCSNRSARFSWVCTLQTHPVESFMCKCRAIYLTRK